MHSTLKFTRLLALAAALFALALVATGCGNDDGGSAEGPEAEISAIVEESVAFEDPPTICEENFTEKALEDNYEGENRAELVEDCGDDDSTDAADIEVSNIQIDGDTATADVSVTDEEDETSEITVELVDDAGWKIDGVS